MFRPSLSNPDVFVVHVDEQEQGIQVGILLLSDNFTPGIHCLYLPDGKFVCSVNIPVLFSPSYGVLLNYAALSNTEAS